jgi:hypothetical protein
LRRGCCRSRHRSREESIDRRHPKPRGRRQKELAKALAKQIEQSLPTSESGSEWWVDPTNGGPQISVPITSMLTLIAYRFAIGFVGASVAIFLR